MDTCRAVAAAGPNIWQADGVHESGPGKGARAGPCCHRLSSLRDAINSHDAACVADCFTENYQCDMPLHPSRSITGRARVLEVVSDPEARYFGGWVEKHSLVPLGEARLGRIAFDERLRRSGAAA
jgi:hypothetical protein